MFSLCWFTAQDRTASVPKHPECSQSSELLISSVEWVGFADMDTAGLCTPPPPCSWSAFPWWCSQGATALLCHYRICKTALLCSNPQLAINHLSFFLDISLPFGSIKMPLFKNFKLYFVHQWSVSSPFPGPSQMTDKHDPFFSREQISPRMQQKLFHCARIAHLQFLSNTWISSELLNMSYIKSKQTPEMQCGINILQTLVFQLVFFSVKNAILSIRNWCASSNLSCWPFTLVPTVCSISHSKILPRTDARLISSLLHNHLIYPFKHWDYNHFHAFYLLSQLPSI